MGDLFGLVIPLNNGAVVYTMLIQVISKCRRHANQLAQAPIFISDLDRGNPVSVLPVSTSEARGAIWGVRPPRLGLLTV